MQLPQILDPRRQRCHLHAKTAMRRRQRPLHGRNARKVTHEENASSLFRNKLPRSFARVLQRSII